MQERWSQVLTGVKERKRMLEAFLSESDLVALNDEVLLLAMDDLHQAVLDDRENRALLGEEIERAFGRKLGFRCTTRGEVVAPRPPTTAEEVQPLIERAIDWFEGEIVERRPRLAARPGRGGG